MRGERQSGQAMVESALTLPLVIFVILGTLQVFLLLQARMMAQYAVIKATRAGSLEQGSCRPMVHSAMAALLPTLARTDSPATLAAAFARRRGNQYAPELDGGHSGQIVELVRERPLLGGVGEGSIELRPGDEEDLFFDQPHVGGVDTQSTRREPLVLEVRMLYWYRMRIPFANWVLGRMFLAHFGLRDYTAVNPLQPTQQAGWTKAENSQGPDHAGEAWPGGLISTNMLRWEAGQHYMVPIVVSATLRMMTPARRIFFTGGPLGGQGCPLTPPYPGLGGSP